MRVDQAVTVLMLAVGVVPLVTAVAFGVWLVRRSSRQDREFTARAVELAGRHGFRIDPSKKPPPGQRFDAFGVGSGQSVRHQMWREGTEHSVFDYSYVVSSGDGSSTHHRTCGLVRLGIRAPHTKISGETFLSSLGRRLGIRDIETESIRFDETFRVSGDDERFAVTLLDGRFIDWLMHHAPHGPGSVQFELWDDWLLCVTRRLPTDQQFGFLDWVVDVPRHFPDVLMSLYPAAATSRSDPPPPAPSMRADR